MNVLITDFEKWYKKVGIWAGFFAALSAGFLTVMYGIANAAAVPIILGVISALGSLWASLSHIHSLNLVSQEVPNTVPAPTSISASTAVTLAPAIVIPAQTVV